MAGKEGGGDRFGWVRARNWITNSHGSQGSSCPKPRYGCSSYHGRRNSITLSKYTNAKIKGMKIKHNGT